MFRIAIVEDDKEQADRLQGFIERYCKENNLEYQVTCFRDGEEILTNYKAVWDLILMDIEMPHIDGMKAAQRIREKDNHTILIFVTAMARYAIRGYEVNAFDFVLKPVQYAAFSLKLRKVTNMLRSRETKYILINSDGRMAKLAANDILYIEVTNHKLAIHTRDHVLHQNGNIKDMEKQLEDYSFFRCNSGYLVNLQHVQEIDPDSCLLSDGSMLPVSRARKKEFLRQFAEYIGGNFH